MEVLVFLLIFTFLLVSCIITTHPSLELAVWPSQSCTNLTTAQDSLQIPELGHVVATLQNPEMVPHLVAGVQLGLSLAGFLYLG